MRKKIVINTEAENYISVLSKEGSRMYYATHIHASGLLNVIKYVRTLPRNNMVLKWKTGFDHGESELNDESIDKLETFLKTY